MSEPSKHANLLNALDEMQHSMHYKLRHGVLRNAELLIASQEQRILELEQGMRENLGLAMACAEAWDGKAHNNGFSGDKDIGADIRERLQLGVVS